MPELERLATIEANQGHIMGTLTNIESKVDLMGDHGHRIKRLEEFKDKGIRFSNKILATVLSTMIIGVALFLLRLYAGGVVSGGP